ncbi:MAG TPA: ABC transporter permease [Thermoplasmata archaeon]
MEAQDRTYNLLLSLPLTIFLLVFFVAPFAFIFLYAFDAYSATHQWTGAVSLRNFGLVLVGPTAVIFWKTVQVAGAVTLLSFVLGYPVAYYIAEQERTRREFLLMLLMVPFWTSFLLRTLSLMTLFSESGLANQFLAATGISQEPVFLTRNFVAVMWAETYTFMPFMILPMYATLERLSRPSIEASYILGAGRIQTFLRVVLPLSVPGILAGSLLVFIISMGELVIPALVGGVDYGYLIGNSIYERYGLTPGTTAALSLLFMGIVLTMSIVYLRVAGREGLRL